MLLHALTITLVVVSTSLLVKTLFVVLQTTKQTRKALKILTLRSIAMEALVVSLLVLGIVWLMLSFERASHQSLAGIGLAVLLSATLPTYAFFIEPIMLLKGSHFTDVTPSYQAILSACKKGIRILETNSDVLNAYATGIIPYSQTIILGKRLREQLTPEETTSIIYHEIGHLKKNHLLKLYLINLLVITLSVISFSFLRPSLQSASMPLLWVGIHGAASAAVLLLLSAMAQRSFEKQADVFAARSTGTLAIIDALKKMDQMSGGQVSRKSLNYPTLQQREYHVKANVVSHAS